ncbi:MAG: phosphoribosylaminoimidazolesuccinocarboxamide synthase [Actinomycetota bacterium]
MAAESGTITSLDLSLTKLASGKVREIFAVDDERLLLVASDRISAYDVVMAQGIPDKGRLLTGMSLFWFELTGDVCRNHLLGSTPADLPPGLEAHHEELRGRTMLVRRLQMLPVEFVIRGYLVGSGWKDYRRTGTVCGVPLPPGLREADRLPEPIFTPATKATTGHDENIAEEQAAEIAGASELAAAKEASLELYRRALAHAEQRGIILADTKFEFGVEQGEIVLADEVLTPDSSRFWPADRWSPGSNPPSLDKQYLRDWLDAQGWDHSSPPPDLPPEVVERTRAGYIEAYERVTGRSFAGYLTAPR